MVIVLIPEIVVGFVVILALFFYFFRQASQQLVEAIAETLRGVPVVGAALARALVWLADRAAHYVAHLFGLAANATLQPLAGFFDHLASALMDFFHATGDLAHATAHTFDVILTSTVPRIIRGLTDHIAGTAYTALHIATFAERLAGQIGGRIHRLTITVERDFALAERHAEKALAAAYGATLAPGFRWTEREIGRLSREAQDALTKRIRAVAAGVAAGVLTGVVLRVLARQAPWVRCSNVGRMGRALCRMPHDRFNGLLSLLTDFLVVVNICKVLPLLEDAASVVATPFVEALTTAGAGLCGGLNPAGDPLDTPALHLPPVQGVTLYLG